MTVIIKELVIRTGVEEQIDRKIYPDTNKLKNEIIKNCLHQLKKNKKQER